LYTIINKNPKGWNSNKFVGGLLRKKKRVNANVNFNLKRDIQAQATGG
jgi:hypothetical protein